MRYYEVLVGDMQYHGKSALTYSSDAELLPGSVVRIALRNRSVLGIVFRRVPEPTFTAKPVAAAAPAQPLPTAALQLIDWLYGYYPSSFGAVIRQFLPPTTAFVKTANAPAPSAKSLTHPEPLVPHSKKLPTLTPPQVEALKNIGSSGYHLLHGITGSGKTRLYVELAKRSLGAGKSAIVLTPEIGLTAQLVGTFEGSFPGSVHVMHSRQTVAQRRNSWYKILGSDKPVVVIGPRSALFAPVQKLGLIVIDESHDQAYKSESAPHYRTERVAAKLAQLHGACLVSGSATPSVEDYYLAAAKNRPLVSLHELAVQRTAETETLVVDLRDRSVLTRSPILSTPLLQALQHALETGNQSMLFLNRRGTAGAVLCAACGWRALCNNCDLSLTYHGDHHAMRCHICGRTRPLPSSCPECGETDIVLKTIGTKAVVAEVKRLFPQARVSRFDTDTAKAEQLETQLDTLQAGDVDIIIGTQMITKGLDLPKLTVVGVLNADASLLIPDYTANERTFQLLTQVFGRTARGHGDGTVVIQSYNPNHPTLQAAIHKNWSTFYESELAERKSFKFPPFVYLLKLTCLRATNGSAEKTAMKLSGQIQKDHPKLNVEGPSPAFHPRESGKYKWQLIVKSTSRQVLVDIASSLPSGWTHDLDPVNLL
ncbi:primosomal protein N' [Candidatus Saccharibacteria bacterium]|nr:MAG: primosomal protein N' [Candidatus Saccharibacteria bacterium]